MAVLKKFKLVDKRTLSVYKKSFKTDDSCSVVYLDIDINDLHFKFLEQLVKLLNDVYLQGKEQRSKEVNLKYKEFVNTFIKESTV